MKQEVIGRRTGMTLKGRILATEVKLRQLETRYREIIDSCRNFIDHGERPKNELKKIAAYFYFVENVIESPFIRFEQHRSRVYSLGIDNKCVFLVDAEHIKDIHDYVSVKTLWQNQVNYNNVTDSLSDFWDKTPAEDIISLLIEHYGMKDCGIVECEELDIKQTFILIRETFPSSEVHHMNLDHQNS